MQKLACLLQKFEKEKICRLRQKKCCFFVYYGYTDFLPCLPFTMNQTEVPKSSLYVNAKKVNLL